MEKQKRKMEKIFTDKFIRELKYEGKGKAADFVQEQHRPGFGIRVYPTGTKTFAFRYKFMGKEKYLPLGRVNVAKGEETGVVDARKKWREAYLLHTSGQDPDTVKAVAKKERIADLQARTVKQLGGQYIADLVADKRKKTWKKDEDYLVRVVYPAIGKYKARDVTPDDINAMLEKYAKVGLYNKHRKKRVPAPIGSNRCLEVVQSMFKYGISIGVIEPGKSPAVDCKRYGVEATPSDRTLSAREIRYLWQKFSDPAFSYDKMTKTAQKALMITLLTGQRSGEVVQMHTKEINGHDWIIPGEVTRRGVTTEGKTKNKQEQYVYLTDTTLEILATLTDGNDDDYIFKKKWGQGKRTETYISQNTLGSAVGKCIKDGYLEMEHWTPHDLRSTPATMLSTLGVPDTLLQRLLNHKLPGVLDRYNRNKFKAEKKLLLLTWEHLIKQIISGEIEEVEFDPEVWEQFIERKKPAGKVINLQQRRESKDPTTTLLAAWQQAVLTGERRGFEDWCLALAAAATSV